VALYAGFHGVQFANDGRQIATATEEIKKLDACSYLGACNEIAVSISK